MARRTLRTSVYVDGFNLYYRALKGTRFKWLDVRKLAEGLLAPENDVTAIRYYTAIVADRGTPETRDRQGRYLRALETVRGLSIHKGRFLTTSKWMRLDTATGDIFRPRSAIVGEPAPEAARVIKTEEKGSDVNLACHLVADGYENRYDVAVVVSNDTDLTEAIRLVRENLGRPVGVICPSARPAGDLLRVAAFLKRITPARLRASQFPDSIPGTNLRRPAAWQ